VFAKPLLNAWVENGRVVIKLVGQPEGMVSALVEKVNNSVESDAGGKGKRERARRVCVAGAARKEHV